LKVSSSHHHSDDFGCLPTTTYCANGQKGEEEMPTTFDPWRSLVTTTIEGAFTSQMSRRKRERKNAEMNLN
jgi:hypothetical protein